HGVLLYLESLCNDKSIPFTHCAHVNQTTPCCRSHLPTWFVKHLKWLNINLHVQTVPFFCAARYILLYFSHRNPPNLDIPAPCANWIESEHLN
uniref:Uncharacterized protein n=1 Tax=Anopheles quadriannulatus TaxID=34691 RepID=A0A182XSI2_ANOQN